MTVLSADWVLPVDGPPIRDGAVAVEDGRIAAVGTAAELGTGTRYECAAIVPGFVNAHTHLEYAVYAGFGDGLDDFAAWIGLHTRRKRQIGWDEYVDIARLGAAECLASGVTTVGDCSFSGAAALAADELGLRALVYLETFGVEGADALERFAELRARAADAVSDRVRLGISPHAAYSVGPRAYRACLELGCRRRRTSQRARRKCATYSTEAARGAGSRGSSILRGRPGSGFLPRRGCSGPS
jgi:cytosine/adenosine deaminase-related metal-dependent hydrolase